MPDTYDQFPWMQYRGPTGYQGGALPHNVLPPSPFDYATLPDDQLVNLGPGRPSQPAIMRTPGPGDRPTMFGSTAGGDLEPDPAGSVPGVTPEGNRVAMKLPAQPMSWGLANPALPSQLNTYLRNYSGGVGSLDEALLQGLIQSAKQGGTDVWNASSMDFGHGNAGLPDSGANLPADATMAGMGTGPRRVGGNDLSDSSPAAWLGTLGIR